MSSPQLHTLGALRASGYQPVSIKEELRRNLITAIKSGKNRFPGIIGYDYTVLPDVERAILSKQNILLLGLRGQAKTRIARLMVNLLDEWMPIIEGSELNDDPMAPLSRFGLDLVYELGDNTPITWVHRSDRYVEKLATPDVSVADLIGDVDPIKAANLKLNYSDERVLHFGLVPRSHRCIFVINELPDLQARIQVSLFNILQEGDIQIRGFKLRLPLDIAFMFTANPEDYTNRGSIITPLKDRIESQILTHYLGDVEQSMAITQQEAQIPESLLALVKMPAPLPEIIEQIVLEARESELIDGKSGVSPRISIAAMESLYAAAERRMLLTGDTETTVRITDLWGVAPSITGKVELVYEGEQQGQLGVALALIIKAIRTIVDRQFPSPSKLTKKQQKERDPYGTIKAWFSTNALELPTYVTDDVYINQLNQVAGLRELVVQTIDPDKETIGIWMEMVLFMLSSHDVLSQNLMREGLQFTDPMGNLLRDLMNDDEL